MVPLNLTKFTLVMVTLGIILALAIFRPQILPLDPGQPSQAEESVPPAEVNDPAVGQDMDRQASEVAEQLVKLDADRAALQAWEERLNEQSAQIDERIAALRRWEAHLLEMEQALRGREAFSLANLVIGALLAILSIVVMIAQNRRHRTRIQLIQSSQPRPNGQSGRAGRFAGASPPVHGGNGNGNGRHKKVGCVPGVPVHNSNS